jgi:hypothetical protein
MCACILKISNASPTQIVAYKIEAATAALRRYMVRPARGMIEPGKSVEVSVCLNYEQARVENVDLATVRDRFQVVTLGVEVM